MLMQTKNSSLVLVGSGGGAAMSDSADAICNVMNHAEGVERREASPLTASKAGKGGTLPFFMRPMLCAKTQVLVD